MKICYIGDFDPDYNRNKVILSGLREVGVEVILCQSKGWSVFLLFRLLSLYHLKGRAADITIVGYSDFSRWVVIALSLFGFSKNPIVWDAFYSVYDAYVNDKQLVRPGTLKATYHYTLDWLALRASSRVLLDTDEHIRYFVETFKMRPEKFIRVLVGANLSEFKFLAKEKISKDGFLVHFCGHYIPLHGTEHIVEAAKLLEGESDISFRMIGRGQMYKSARKRADLLGVKNIEFVENIPYKKLIDYLVQADVSLGIFGDTGKAKRVVPNKVYEAIALGVPVITGDTPAIREIFTPQKNILVCSLADPQDLARKILEFKRDPILRTHIGEEGEKLFHDLATPRVIGEKLLAECKDFLSSRA